MKLFNIGATDTTPSSVRLSTEIIAVQPNDYAIPIITDIFQRIIDADRNYEPKDSRAFFTKKQFKNLYKELDKAIEDRFGFKVKHISAIGCGYAVMTNPPNNNNVLNREFINQYPEIATALEYDDTKAENIKNPEDINDYNDVVNIYSNWKKSIDSLEDKLNSSGVVIDLQKARITGLPKEYYIFLLSDPKVLINKGELTAIELTAVLMHEIGHIFTHLEYSYRTVENTSVLIDTMHENIVKKGKGYKESITLTYKELGGKEDLSKVNTVTATIKTLNRYNKNSLSMDEGNHSYTDSEQLADQFAGRFGLSNDLASGLDKVMNKTQLKIYSMEFMSKAFVTMGILFIYGILITGTMLGGFLMISYVAIYVIAFTIAFKLTSSVFTMGHTNDEDTYDGNKRRYQRMRNELVRQLRTIDIDKKLVKTILGEIDSIDKVIGKTPDDSNSLNIVDKMFRMLSSTAQAGVNLKEMEQLIEDLQENDLHVGSNKLKTLV